MHVAKTIRELREAAQMSQALLASRMAEEGIEGFHPQTIVKLENGTRALKYVEAVALTRVLNVEVADLMVSKRPSMATERHLRSFATQLKETAADGDRAISAFVFSRANLMRRLTMIPDDPVFAPRAHVVEEVRAVLEHNTLDNLLAKSRFLTELAPEGGEAEYHQLADMVLRRTDGIVLTYAQLEAIAEEEHVQRVAERVEDPGYTVLSHDEIRTAIREAIRRAKAKEDDREGVL
jgi:transcriptional regulator with XRE-family HTH domain